MSCFRHYSLDASLPLRLRPESMEKLRCLRACVIRSLYHMYEPFAARISKNPAIPESTPSTLKNSKVGENCCWGLANGLLCGGPVLWLVCSFLMGRAVGPSPLGVSINVEGSEVSFLLTHFCCPGLVYGIFRASLCF